MSLTVVTGGTRSGKSARAEALATATGLPVRYIATADAADPEMRDRIAAHAVRRPATWTTVQAAGELDAALAGAVAECLLFDGLGAWIASVLHHGGAFDDDERLDAARATVDAGVTTLLAAEAQALVVVAEQAGLGVLPLGRAARAWVDLLGEATQRLSAAADIVELVVAGRPLTLGRATPRVDPALRRHGDQDVVPGHADHAVNVIAGGPPPWLDDALVTALRHGASRYPRAREATEAVAARHGRDAAEVVVSNGAAEALWLLGPALRPALAACIHPGFTEAEAGLRAHGVPVVRVHRDPDRDFALDPAAVPHAADLVVVGNPASPSGTLDPAAAILALRRPGRIVVVDEAFMDLVPGEPGSMATDAPDDVIVIRSLTKALSVPGLRVGYALAAAPLAERLRAVQPPWSANALALAALDAAARHPAELAALAERAGAQRADLEQRLSAIAGVRTWPGAANFVLIEVAHGPGAVASLRAAGIAVRPAASFPGLHDGHIRITARDPGANAAVAAALAQALA